MTVQGKCCNKAAPNFFITAQLSLHGKILGELGKCYFTSRMLGVVGKSDLFGRHSRGILSITLQYVSTIRLKKSQALPEPTGLLCDLYPRDTPYLQDTDCGTCGCVWADSKEATVKAASKGLGKRLICLLRPNISFFQQYFPL